jgi:hypothetical protein
MAETQTFTFNKNNFTSDSPSWSGPQEEYSSNLRFNTVAKTLRLNDSSHGKVSFTVSIPNGIDLGLIYFNTANGGIVSVSDEEHGVYELTNSGTSTIAKVFTEGGSPSSGTKDYYVVVNGDPNSTSRYLNVLIALAKSGSPPTSNIDITLSYTCPPIGGNLNTYTVGLHAYSAYDAKAASSTLTTKLYSSTAVGNWTTNTILYSSPYLNNPALPYFYGYNGKVYRVGDPWSRSYGLKFRHELRVYYKGFWPRKRTRHTRVTLGPMETLDLGTSGNQPTSEACIEPTMRNIGKIRKVYSNDSAIPQPQQYRYYLGYDSTSRRESNDSVFNSYSLAKKKHYPITGLMHALGKLTRGIINGYNTEWDGDVNWTAIAGAAGFGLVASLAGESIISGIAHFFSTIPGPLPSFTSLFGGGAAAALSTVLLALAILFVIVQLIALFSPSTTHFRENCKLFLHHFTTTPYINNGGTLYRDDSLSIGNTGYYCDGVYYYYQSGGTITSKILSSTVAFITEDEPHQFLYSLQADNPTLVEDWQKLILLPYTSGKPIPYCGLDANGNPKTVYYSSALTHTVTTHCCDLEDCSEDTVISLPYGTATSCISQDDADDEAEAQFQAAIDYAETHSVYNGALDDSSIGQLDVNFTHEIKEEDNPAKMTVFWDKRNGSTITVGESLYYDYTGCQKVLPGYYAVSGSSYPKYYYKVEDGEVDTIYTQNAANSTTTTTGQSIIKTNEDKTSNWFLKHTRKTPLSLYLHYLDDRTFDVNSLFTTSTYTLSAGRLLSGSYTDGAFEKYDGYNSDGITQTSFEEQGTGWYAPLNGWKPEEEDLFFYQNGLQQWTGGTQRFVIDGQGLTQLCDGGNTGTTYYHDGDSTSPTLGDRIYDTDDITDPTADGYIKYTTDLYMTVTNGIMVASTSCSPSYSNFTGSALLTNSSTACATYGGGTSYTHDGSNTMPDIGDTIYSSGTAVGAGYIIIYEYDSVESQTYTYRLQTNSSGEVIAKTDCNAPTNCVNYNTGTGNGYYGASYSLNKTGCGESQTFEADFTITRNNTSQYIFQAGDITDKISVTDYQLVIYLETDAGQSDDSQITDYVDSIKVSTAQYSGSSTTWTEQDTVTSTSGPDTFGRYTMSTVLYGPSATSGIPAIEEREYFQVEITGTSTMSSIVDNSQTLHIYFEEQAAG